jgi:hypothetical protein
MKRLLKSWVFWLFAAPGLLAGAVVLLHFEEASYGCACGSRRKVRRLHAGLGRSLVSVGSIASERPSEFYSDLIATRHSHAWASSGGLFLSSGPLGRISCGVSHTCPLADVYDRMPDFRSWLRAKVGSGDIGAPAIDREMGRDTYYATGEYPFGWTPPP